VRFVLCTDVFGNSWRNFSWSCAFAPPARAPIVKAPLLPINGSKGANAMSEWDPGEGDAGGVSAVAATARIRPGSRSVGSKNASRGVEMLSHADNWRKATFARSGPSTEFRI
jgi:hypothetical protein